MFVLISTPAPFSVFNNTKYNQLLNESVLGVFHTKELAIQSIPAYSGTSHAGKGAVIYQMLQDGDKQKRVKIYEGTIPICSPKLDNQSENNVMKILNKRIQLLEEKLEAKAAECNRLKSENNELTNFIKRMKEFFIKV